MSLIKKGIDYKNVGWGLLMIAIGVGIILLGVIGNVKLRLGSLRLPDWAMPALGTIFLLIGSLLVVFSLKSEKCVSCNVVLESGEAFFDGEYLEDVKSAAENLDSSLIQDIPMIKSDKNAVVLSIEYCPSCKEVAIIDTHRYKKYQKTQILERKEVKDTKIGDLIKILEAHGKFRE